MDRKEVGYTKEEKLLYASYEIAEKIIVIKSLKLKQNHKKGRSEETYMAVVHTR